MYTIKINQKHSVEVDPSSIDQSNPEAEINISETGDNCFHILKDNKSYNVEIIRHNTTEKTATIRVNGTKYDVKVEDRFDALLKSLGMDNLTKKKVNHVKAPMPGLVVKINVAEGTEVKKGDALLVLEAMKMENILKSPTDGVVKKVAVKKGMAVEKNQLLIEF